MKNKKTNLKNSNSPAHQKMAQIMHEYEENLLYYCKSKTIVTNHKKAIAAALSEAYELEK